MTSQATIEPRTPKGMRDFLPSEKRVRDAVLKKMIRVFESYGLEPLETPPVELKEVLTGKIGSEEKLIYDVSDKGDTPLALRYDLTVPLARVVAQYPELPKPFKRYQIGNSYRGENTQKGRFRQFLQVDVDTVGSSSPLADAEVIELALNVYRSLGLKVKMVVNSRELLLNQEKSAGVPEDKLISVSVSIDKVMKIGKAGVISEIESKGLGSSVANEVFATLKKTEPNENIKEIFAYLSSAGLKEGQDFVFDPFLARGLDYYTGTVFEADAEGYEGGSVGGGGRYDNLIGKFTGQAQPAVGFSFGFDRTLEALNLTPEAGATVKVLVTVFEETLASESFKLASQLRRSVPTELYTGSKSRNDQIDYAVKKGIPYVAIIGPRDIEAGKLTLVDLATRERRELTVDQALAILR